MRVDPFNQPPPELGNQYDDDPALRAYLDRVLPEDAKEAIAAELREMGELADGELYRMQLEDRRSHNGARGASGSIRSR